ncbi:MAG: protein BatD, partial [Gammaproteobacteria bacterium]|nr:protein BatD [Gammaproteobacteria bacterium]
AAAVGGNWLPADSLTISESWSPSNPTFQVGEPVTRTITILARGLEGAQLPELPISGNKNYKVYPDQPVTPTQFQGQFVMGKREQKIAIVPTLEGSFTLPPIEIPWWDTKADLQRVASLPSRKIKVLPGNTSSPAVAASAPVHPGPHSRGEEQPLRVESEKAPATRTEPISSPSMPGTDRDFWPWLVAGLLLVWLVTIWLWLRERRRSPIKTGKQVAANKPPHTPSLKSLLRAVESACKSSRAADARDALLEWGRSRWPDNPPHNLMVFGDRLGENRQVADAILTLDRTIYGGSTGDWDGERFWRQVEPLLVAGVENKGVKEEVLPELFPV